MNTEKKRKRQDEKELIRGNEGKIKEKARVSEG